MLLSSLLWLFVFVRLQTFCPLASIGARVRGVKHEHRPSDRHGMVGRFLCPLVFHIVCCASHATEPAGNPDCRRRTATVAVSVHRLTGRLSGRSRCARGRGHARQRPIRRGSGRCGRDMEGVGSSVLRVSRGREARFRKAGDEVIDPLTQGVQCRLGALCSGQAEETCRARRSTWVQSLSALDRLLWLCTAGAR